MNGLVRELGGFGGVVILGGVSQLERNSDVPWLHVATFQINVGIQITDFRYDM